MDDTANIYVRGFDGLSAMGQLGGLDVVAARDMVRHVAQEAPDTAAAMWGRYLGSRFRALTDDAALSCALQRGEERRVSRRESARLCGVSEELMDRVMDGAVDREAVELRAQMYRM